MTVSLQEQKGRPRLLDLFCCEGGAARGYQRAGWYVIGVDKEPQSRYCGDEFIQADALEFMDALLEGDGWPWDVDPHSSRCWQLADLAAIHASPPCHLYSKLAKMHPDREYPHLIPPTRERLVASGLPFVMENVEGAPLAHHPQLDGTWGIVLCGSMFGLGVERGELRRHRAFESNVPIPQPGCNHRRRAVGVYGHGGHSGKHRMLYRDEAAEAMDMEWASRDGMTQAIPPAYTEHIGRCLFAAIRERERSAA